MENLDERLEEIINDKALLRAVIQAYMERSMRRPVMVRFMASHAEEADLKFRAEMKGMNVSEYIRFTLWPK